MTKQKGFTLIELLVVIAIIGILAVVVLINLSSSRAKSRDARRMEDMHQILTAVELYHTECGQYPAALNTAEATGCTGTTTFHDFMEIIPTDPSPGVNYVYAYDDINNKFTVNFNLEGNVNQYAPGPHTLSQDGIQ